MYRSRTLTVMALLVGLVLVAAAPAAEPSADKPFKLGMIGLDTSHVVAFTKIINGAKPPSRLAKFRVVAAFKGGSPDIPTSADRVDKFTKTLKEQYQVEICPSIEALCKKVDGILLESVDGRPHLRQAKPVIEAGLPMFIDKPMAGSLADVIEIFRLCQKAGVPVWSSSSLRYWPPVMKVKDQIQSKKVKRATSWGPLNLEPHHPDLFWYGVHGCEILFSVMGPGCVSVIREEGTDKVTGTWADGRIGVFDPTLKKKKGRNYGVIVETADGTFESGKGGGYYEYLLEKVAIFFETGKPPVPAKETINLFAFMEGADESKRQGYTEVKISDVVAKAKKKAAGN